MMPSKSHCFSYSKFILRMFNEAYYPRVCTLYILLQLTISTFPPGPGMALHELRTYPDFGVLTCEVQRMGVKECNISDISDTYDMFFSVDIQTKLSPTC